MTRESYIVENFSTFTLSTFMSSHAAFIHLMPICILSPVHVPVCYSTSLSKMPWCISLFQPFLTCTLLLHHIHARHPSFVSLISILLAILHIGCIQTAHVLLFRLAHTHKYHHHTSMPSFLSLLPVDVLHSPSVLL